MGRGDIVIVALTGDLGKPRPALVVQSDIFSDGANITIIPITSTVLESQIRVTVEPTPANGLQMVSQIMTDRVTTASRTKVRNVIGRLEEDHIRTVDQRLSLLLGLS